MSVLEGEIDSAVGASSEASKASEEDLKVETKLLSTEETLNPSIKPWKMSSFKQEKIKKEKKIRSDVIEKLRKEVEPEIKEQTSLIKKNAYDEAFKKGSEEGFKQGLQSGKLEGKKLAEEEASKILQPQVKSLQDLSEFMVQPYQKITEEVFVNLVAITTEIASKIIKKEITESPEWILQVLEEAVAKLPSERVETEIFLNPDDLEVVKKHASSTKNTWKLVPDASLTYGTCKVIQNSSSLVDDWQDKLAELINQSYVTSKSVLVDEDSPSSSYSDQASEKHGAVDK